jgi:hypothetical protein
MERPVFLTFFLIKRNEKPNQLIAHYSYSSRVLTHDLGRLLNRRVVG